MGGVKKKSKVKHTNMAFPELNDALNTSVWKKNIRCQLQEKAWKVTFKKKHDLIK